MNEVKKAKNKKIAAMLAYASGDMLGGGVGQVISAYYLTFLLYVVGLNPLLAGLVTGVGKVWDGITDPVMGVVVDRTKTKLGACRPYFLLAILPVFLSYFMLWYGFGIEGQTAKFIYFAFAYIFFSTAFTIFMVPYEALLPRMVDSYRERTDFSSLRMIFSGVSCVVSTYIYEWLVPTATLSADNTNNFMMLGLVLGAFFSLPLIFTFFGTKENYAGDNSEKLTLKIIFHHYKQILSSKTYKKYFALNLLGAFVSSAILSSLMVFVYLVYGNVQDYFWIFSLTFLVINLKGGVEIAFFPINVILMKKYNKHRPYLIDVPLIVISCLIILFVTPSTPIWVFLIAMAFLGAGTSCLGFVPMTLLPDLADVDELVYGKRREGQNAGLTTMAKKIVSGLALTLFGAILGIFGLSTNNASLAQGQIITTQSMIAVKLMFCVIPIICSLVMIIISRTYKLDEKRHTVIKNLISRKKETNEKLSLTQDEIEICEEVAGMDISKMWINN